jgi:hypothetical protein
MNQYADIEEKFKLMVRELGALEDGLEISHQQLKEIALDLGVTESAWEYFQNKAEQNLGLIKQHFNHKNYRETILATEDVLLLNPHIKGVKGWIAKSLLMLAIHEDERIFLPQAKRKADSVLKREPTDQMAMEVLSTINSKSRIAAKDAEKGHSNKVMLVVLGLVLFVGIAFGIQTIFADTSLGREKIEAVEKQVQSAFEKQEALIPKVRALLQNKVEDADFLNKLDGLTKALKGASSLKEQYKVHEELTNLLGSIVYYKSSVEDSELLNDLRVLLEGAENRIKTERKQYNDAILEFNAQHTGTPLEKL